MKKVLITGTSRGIGQEIVRQLLEKTDFYIFATMRQPHGPRRPQQETDRMTVLALDVAEAGSIAILAKDLLALGVKLDAIVHNAGIYGGSKSPANPREVMLTNYYGPQRLTDALRPLLSADARIVCISSGMGELSAFSRAAARDLQGELSVSDLNERVERYLRGEEIGWPSNAYSASKGALNTLVRCWHRELKGETYVAICPGWVRTDMGGEGAPRSVEKGAQTPVWALTVPDLPGGLFYRDRQPISW